MTQLPNQKALNAASSVSQTLFHFEWGGEADLSVREIWPDGDAPENPTVDDVLAEVRKSGHISQLLDDWNLPVERVEIEGKDSGLR